jgi:hypothetical protein
VDLRLIFGSPWCGRRISPQPERGERGRWAGLKVFALFTTLVFSSAASGQQANPDTSGGGASANARVTVHGVVLNTASGDPLPRALVRLTGDSGAGALTDGEGRYELADIPTGPQQIEIIKPGFLDAIAEGTAAAGGDAREFAHTVLVAAGMPGVTFRMEPANAIHGQVQLSTGDMAEGIEITLLRQTVQSGRFVWQVTATTKTTAEGVFRFGALADGTYVVYSAPAMDNEALSLFAHPKRDNVERAGYASQFYPEARDLAGAAKIQLREGQQAEANLSLALETFHDVAATVSVASDGPAQDFSPDRAGTTLSAVVVDSQGHQLPYQAQYDPITHAVQALLPDGNYALVATAGRPTPVARRLGLNSSPRDGGPFTGAVEFAVSGHPVTNLRIALANTARSALQVSIERSGATADVTAANSEGHAIVLTISQTGGWVTDGMISTFALGSLTGPINTMFAAPGNYWVHTNLADRRYCEASLMAGGSNLAREPLTLSVSGSPAPLTLAVRDDCASLTLSLPPAADGSGVGEEPFYTIYVVPDFDSTADVIPQTLRPSDGGKVTLQGLTPGSYHVYAFDQPVALPYHEKAPMDALPNHGQTIELSPGQAASLVLEVP